MNKTKAAVIGLGSMGFGMAVSLARQGLDVAGADLSAEAVQRFSAHGRAVNSAPEAAAGAAILVVVVVNAAQTRAVLFGPQGAVKTLPKGAVIISSATMSPKDAEALAAEAEAQGLLYLDAPISGGAQRAAEGALTILASGSDAAFETAQPALDAMAAKLYRLGDKPGIGAAFKMVNQLLAGVHIAAACEAITFAKRLGLDIGKVYEVITAAAGNSWMFENRVPHILEGDYTPRSAVDIFTKDLGIVLDMSRDTRFPTPIAGQAFQIFMMTAAAGMGRDDDASVARLYAEIAGLELPKGSLRRWLQPMDSTRKVCQDTQLEAELGRWMKDADKDRLASLVRRIEAADQMDRKLKEERESAEARERQRREDMLKNWQSAFQGITNIVHELNPQLSPRGMTLAVEGSGNISGAVGRITIIVAAGTPIVHKSMALNLAQTGTVQLVYTGVAGRPAGAAFELDSFDRDAFADLIFKFLEAVIAEREQSQIKRQSEIGADKPAG